VDDLISALLQLGGVPLMLAAAALWGTYKIVRADMDLDDSRERRRRQLEGGTL
jgi:hypothetical protein